ncbi:MAG: murein L,D-transpeptidase catalytic domain family protein [Gemmatimonadota bacterium]
MTRALIFAGLLGWPLPVPVGAGDTPEVAIVVEDDVADVLYREMDLGGVLPKEVFVAGHRSMNRDGLQGRMLAIADMSQPSTARRLYVFDLAARRLVLRTWVAHGANSGGLMARRFSNREGSHQTSLGLYRVGQEIVSPKHGPALLLHGMDHGLNDQARAREIIIHGADYVSSRFIAANGRLGRSWGCPAVPRDEMDRVIELLADGGLLYVYAS